MIVLRILRWEISLHYPGRPNVITRVLKREEEAGESDRQVITKGEVGVRRFPAEREPEAKK